MVINPVRVTFEIMILFFMQIVPGAQDMLIEFLTL